MSNYWKNLINSKKRTEIPLYAINKELPEDTFFTNRSLSKKYYNIFLEVCKKEKININRCTFVEPSAGEGCFFDLLPNGRKIGIDIKPRSKGIITHDYLTWYPKEEKQYIVIGNPPFGVRGALALAFIKRSLLFADMVAFILPMSFYTNGKGSNMNRITNASLIYNELIQEESPFYTLENKKISVQTVFQIWKKGIVKKIFNEYDISNFVKIYTVCSSPKRLCGLDKLKYYDCYIASTFYKDTNIVYKFEDVKYGSGYGIIIYKDKEKIIKLLKNVDWKEYSSGATNKCRHIRMHHIKYFLYKNGYGEKVK